MIDDGLRPAGSCDEFGVSAVLASGESRENGFHATSMDDVIAASGMSSSAVYRYFRSKDELIGATTDEGLAKVQQIFVGLLAYESCPTPAQTLALLVGELDSRVENSEYDMSRTALQTWAEALRNPRCASVRVCCIWRHSTT